MVENSSGPSKLHLKKQLIRYGKAPMLREPQLFPSSSTSFSNFKSTPAACQIHEKEAEAKSTGVNKKRRTKTYLYDPGNHSSNSENADSLKSVSESLGYNSSNHVRRTRSEKNLDDFMSMCRSAVSKARSFCDSKSEELEHQAQIGRHKPAHSYIPSRSRHSDTVGSLRGSSAIFDGFGEVGLYQLHQRRTQGHRSGEASAFLDGFGEVRQHHRGYRSSRKKDDRRGSKIRHHSEKSKKNSSLSNNHESLSQRYQSVPLLEDDDLSSSIQELELEAFSQLCQILHGGSGREILESRSLSEKYRPRSFEEILGQPFVVESLKNAISKGTSPAFVFQGPSGTGKTTAAMVFAAALNCESTDDKRPCGSCNTCTDTMNNRNGPIIELGTNTKKGMNRLRYILKHAPAATSIRQFVLVVDGCRILSPEVWLELCRVVEDAPPRVAFIFTVTHQANLPHSIMSRCKKYRFLKISEADIVSRLRVLCAKENIDTEEEALEVIARCSCGSLLEAEMMLDQSALLGKRITPTTVKDLVGFVSDDTALGLLEAALSSDTIETVRKSRELMDSGVDPVALMSQLAGFLTDIIAGTHKLATQQGSDAPYRKNILTEVKLDRLLQALQILSDAEKQLSLSGEPSTWFTAALIKLSSHNPEPNTPSSCSRNSNEKLNDASNKPKHASKNSFSHPLSITSSISKVKSGSYSTQASHLIGSQVDEERSQDLTLLIQSSGRNNGGDYKTFLHEQRLDNAWKEEAKKGETEFRTHSRIDSSHSLWHSDSRNAGQNGLARIIAGSTNQCAFNTDTNKLNPQSSQHVYKREHNRMSKRHHPTLSPSLLHIDNLMADLANKKQGHEVAAEYDGFCCWKTSKPKNREMREERGARPNMAGILPCFGKRWERKNEDGRYRT